MSISLPVVLVSVPATQWTPNSPMSQWPQILAAQLRLGRNLAKGVDFKDVRLALRALGREVSTALQADPRLDRWHVPANLLEAWDALLRCLAHNRGLAGGQQLDRERAAPFCPCVFAPGPSDSHHAGSYGTLTVAGHIAELSTLEHNLTKTSPRLLPALQERRARFQTAATLGAGIVEYVVPEW